MARNKLQGLTIEIGGDTTNLSKALKQPNKEAGELQSKLSAVNQTLKMDPGNMDLLDQKFRLLGQSIDKNKEKLELLKNAQSQFIAGGGDIDSAEYIELQKQITATTAKINKLEKEQIDVANSFDDLGNASSDIRKLDKEVDNLDDSLDDVEKSSGGVGDALKGAFLGAGIVEGIKGIASSIGDMVDSSKEYIKIMASLETSSKNAGYSAEETEQTYNSLYEVLGDNQTAATTTANLQALGLSQEKLTQLTNGTIGAWAKYGDSIPIDSLSEAINETAKVGKVTGTFADVLNWAGTNEDEFNEKLSKCSSESERADLILQELSKQGLMESADAWRENAGALIDSNNAQAKMGKATAKMSQIVLPIIAGLQSAFADTLSTVVGLFSGDIGVDEFAKKIVSGISNITKSLPKMIESGSQIMKNIGKGMEESIPFIMENGLKMLQSLSQTLLENIPILVSAGMDMIGGLLLGFVNSLPSLIEYVPSIISNIADTISSSWQVIFSKGAEIIFNLIKGIISAIPTLVANIPKIISAFVNVMVAFNWMELGSKVINFFVNGITSMFGFVAEAGTGIFNSIVNVLMKLPAKLWDLAVTGFRNFISGISSTISSISATVIKIASSIISTIASLPSKLLSYGAKIFSNFVSGITSKLSSVKTAASKILSAVTDVFKNSLSTLKNVGVNLVKGLWNGISSVKDWILSKIKGFTSGILKGIKSFFGIHSPSKVMETEVGKFLPAGIGEGIDKNSNLALAPLKQLKKEMTSSFDPSIDAQVNKSLQTTNTFYFEIPIETKMDGKVVFKDVTRKIFQVQSARMSFKGV